MRYRVRFNSVEEVLEFVKIASKLPEDMDILAEDRLVVDAKSVLGLLSCCRLNQEMQLRIYGQNAERCAQQIRSFIVAQG